MSPEFRSALYRASLQGLATAALAVIGVLQVGGTSREALYAAASALVSVLAGRGALEGLYDTRRARDAAPPPSKGD